MVTESVTIQGLYIISLALRPIERWGAARDSFNADSSSNELLTVFAIVALVISIILLIWVFIKHRRSEDLLNLKITDLTVTNVKLQQENEKLTATNEELRQENSELTANNEKLQQENDKLTVNNENLQRENTEFQRKQAEVLENTINAETPRK